jgi:hypothetical protein
MSSGNQAHKKARTTLEREHFENLVTKAERLLESRPRAYRIRLAFLAILGYAVIFGILFLLIALIAGSVWAALTSTIVLLILIKKKLVIVLALIAWVLIKSLWVRMEPPQGYEIRRSDAPALFRDLDSYSKRLATPRIHTVLLNEEFNASILQIPRLGVLGWQKNTLILGLPLLISLKLDEARAVVGHELGHLSGNHSRFNGWIYRVRISWYRIMDSFNQAAGFGTGLLRRFFDRLEQGGSWVWSGPWARLSKRIPWSSFSPPGVTSRVTICLRSINRQIPARSSKDREEKRGNAEALICSASRYFKQPASLAINC